MFRLGSAPRGAFPRTMGFISCHLWCLRGRNAFLLVNVSPETCDRICEMFAPQFLPQQLLDKCWFSCYPSSWHSGSSENAWDQTDSRHAHCAGRRHNTFCSVVRNDLTTCVILRFISAQNNRIFSAFHWNLVALQSFLRAILYDNKSSTKAACFSCQKMFSQRKFELNFIFHQFDKPTNPGTELLQNIWFASLKFMFP